MESAMENNGLILNSYFVPPEIFAHILHFIDPHDLVFNCRLVCKNWNQIIIDDVWRLKLLSSKYRSFSKLSDGERTRLKLPWYISYQICSKDPFEKNLLLNNCGQKLGEQCWNREYTSVRPNERWMMEPPPIGSVAVRRNGPCVIEPYPIGADFLPECDDFGGHKSCFVTSHIPCVKEQTIDLWKNGLSELILDTMQPKIMASEWYAGRYDFCFKYDLTVSLISSDAKSVIQRKEIERGSHEPSRGLWEKVSFEFENYGPGVRFVQFCHCGRDSRTWVGFYSAKMAGGVVKVALSNITDSVAQP